MSRLKRAPGSFRDPAGHVLIGDDCVFRSLTPSAYADLEPFLRSPTHARLVSSGGLIASEVAPPDQLPALHGNEQENGRRYLRHPRIGFASFPYEWSQGMLLDAALRTLEVQDELLEGGYTLKDATAYNILFDSTSCGPSPVFIDVASVEAFDGGAWAALGQFVRHFVLPLALGRSLDWQPSELFLAYPDGVDPDVVYRRIGRLRRFAPPYFLLLTLPRLLAGLEQRTAAAATGGGNRTVGTAAGRRWIRMLRRQLIRGRRQRRSREWHDYLEAGPYTPRATSAKRDFVRRMCQETGVRSVLDVGCHLGDYSLLAAECGASVVAIDRDQQLIDGLYRRARAVGARVLPLAVDLASPSPAIGWDNAERPSFLARCTGFDCVFALAVVHHLLVRNRVPLEQVVDRLHGLTSRYLILELVDRADPMFDRLAFGNEPLYQHCTIAWQENAFLERFTKRAEERIEGMNRRLYLLEKRAC